MTKNLEKIIAKEDLRAAQLLLRSVTAGTQLLSEHDIRAIDRYVKSGTQSRSFIFVIWSLAIVGDHTSSLVPTATQLITTAANSNEDYTYIHAADAALSYLLYRASEGTRIGLIKAFSKRGPNHLRMAVAEYLVANSDIEKGLEILVDILPDCGTDHALTDSIAISLTMYGTHQYKTKLIKSAAECVAKGDKTRALFLNWAARCIDETKSSQ